MNDPARRPFQRAFLRLACGLILALFASGLAGRGESSVAASAPPPPAAPGGLVVSASTNSSITLRWNDVADETGYRIERKIGTTGNWKEINKVSKNATAYADKKLKAGTLYVYRVRAYNKGGNSGYSNEVQATPGGAPPPSGPDNRFGVIMAWPLDGPAPTAEKVAAMLQGVGATYWYDFIESTFSVPATHRIQLVRTGERWLGSSASDLQARVAANPGATWMIGNEPNVPAQDNADPEQYAEQFHAAVQTIKGNDPSARIVAPNVLNWETTCRGCEGFPRGRTWVEQFLRAYRARYGGSPPIDVWGIHTYEIDWQSPPMVDAVQGQNELKAFRKFVDKQSGQGGKPIWLTEFGVIWAYEGYRTVTRDGQGVIVPTGRYRDDLVVQYVRSMAAWLLANSGPLKIERWFIYASYGPPEPYATQSAVLSLYRGPSAESGLTPAGVEYRDYATGAKH